MQCRFCYLRLIVLWCNVALEIAARKLHDKKVAGIELRWGYPLEIEWTHVSST